jgi:hypothetical protein
VLAKDGLSYDVRTDIGWVSLAILFFVIFANISAMAILQFKATKKLLNRANSYLSCSANPDTERSSSPSFGEYERASIQPELTKDGSAGFIPNRKK